MFKIGKLFHLTHVLSDLDAVDKWYDDVFAATRFYHAYAKAAGRDVSLIAIGEAIMEPMIPGLNSEPRDEYYRSSADREDIANHQFRM